MPAELRSRSLKTTRWNVRHLALVPCVAVTVGAPEGDLLPSQWTARELVSRNKRASSPDRATETAPTNRASGHDHTVLSGLAVKG